MPYDAAKRRWAPWLNAFLVLAVLGAVAWGAWHLSKGGASNQMKRTRPAATVGLAKAALADMPVTVSAIGTVQPLVMATIRPQLSGTLTSLQFTEGQMVKQGDLLAEIDSRPYRLALSLAEANLQRDEAQLNAAKVDLKRYKGLLTQDSIAHQQVDTQTALVKQLEGTVAADKAAVGTARLNLEYTQITAPVSGRVGLRLADIGNYLTPSDATGIVVITQTDPIDVSFALPQGDIPEIQKQLNTGATLPVIVRDQAGRTTLATGKFLTFDNQIDTASGTVKAKARFANPDGLLYPNQFVNVTVEVEVLHQAVTVPVSAVRHGAQGGFVFILQPDKTVKLQTVTTGPSDTAKVVIKSGVNVGDSVVTEGADNLDDGSRVTLPGERRNGGADKNGKNGKSEKPNGGAKP